MRTNGELDDDLIAQAFALTGVRTKKAVVDLALRELVRNRRRKDLTELAGRIELRSDFNYKALRDSRCRSR